MSKKLPDFPTPIPVSSKNIIKKLVIDNYRIPEWSALPIRNFMFNSTIFP